MKNEIHIINTFYLYFHHSSFFSTQIFRLTSLRSEFWTLIAQPLRLFLFNLHPVAPSSSPHNSVVKLFHWTSGRSRGVTAAAKFKPIIGTWPAAKGSCWGSGVGYMIPSGAAAHWLLIFLHSGGVLYLIYYLTIIHCQLQKLHWCQKDHRQKQPWSYVAFMSPTKPITFSVPLMCLKVSITVKYQQFPFSSLKIPAHPS